MYGFMSAHRWRKILSACAIFACTLASLAGAPQPAQAASPNVVISQVYGGGGNSGAPYTNDFVELFNRGNTTVSLDGWSVQYTSATSTGKFGESGLTKLSGSLAPGQYLLVKGAGGATGAPLPTADVTGTINMSGSAGKVALVNRDTSLGCNGSSTPCLPDQLAAIIDLVGYGSANFYEGAGAAPGLSNTTAALRAGGGCQDTDDNSADFTAAAPAPRNTASPLQPCGSGPVDQPLTAGGPNTLTTEAGTPASATLTASDPDTQITGAAITSAPVAGIALSDFVTAVDGFTASVRLNVDATVAGGDYSVTVRFTNSAGQTADKTVAVSVTLPPGVCPAPPASAPYSTVGAVQGSGAASPVINQARTVRGRVVADFQGASGMNGFFVQDAGDSDAATSDGIFVFVPAANPLSSVDVQVGEAVQVSGTAKEFNGLTEIDNVTAITKCGDVPEIAPAVVDLPEPVNGDLERFEGMLVTIPETLTVDQNFFQGRYGQVTLSSDGRLFTPTNSYVPGSPEAIAQADENARRMIVLDDTTSQQNPNPIPYIGADNTLRAGDTTSGLTGVIDYGPISSDSTIRDYRLQPTAPVTFTRANPRTPAPEPVGGNARVASFNVLNYFNGDGLGGGFPTPRGANTPAEFARQRAKIIAAIVAIDPDVVGLMEMENDGNDATSAIQDLVNGLNDATAPGTYALVPAPNPGSDQIKVEMIYKPRRVTPVGESVNDVNTVYERQPLAQTFRLNANGAVFSVVVNHLKSKRCDDATGDDLDKGDGQGCYNATRIRQAQALLAFIEDIKGRAGDGDVLAIGDFNSYGMEDPIRALTGAGMVNEVARYVAQPYSYVFDGLAGYLDHALATPSLDPQVTGVTEWHINADEPSVIDYNTEFKPQDLYAPTPYRASDHDSVIVDLQLNGPPTVTINLPLVVNEGSSITLTATGSDPDGDALTYRWDLDNDGTFETAGQSAVFSAAGIDGPATRTVRVQVSDPSGLTATAEATVTIANAAPAVSKPLVIPEPSFVGRGVAVLAQFSDARPNDAPFACAVDYGDGSPVVAGEVVGRICYGPIHTYAKVGTYSITVRVADKDGGIGAATAQHTVIYNFGGFFAPVLNMPWLNISRAGSAVPVKFSLGGDRGLDVFAPGYPQSQAVGCSSTDPIDGGDPTVSPGGLSYNSATGIYTYVWKTDRAWARQCRQLVVKLNDGTYHRARFWFW